MLFMWLFMCSNFLVRAVAVRSGPQRATGPAT